MNRKTFIKGILGTILFGDLALKLGAEAIKPLLKPQKAEEPPQLLLNPAWVNAPYESYIVSSHEVFSNAIALKLASASPWGEMIDPNPLRFERDEKTGEFIQVERKILGDWKPLDA